MKKIKLICVLCFLVFGIGAFFTDNGLVATVESFSGGPPASRTGAPGEVTCTSCHAQNAGSGLFTITAPTSYTPGQVYPITVQHSTADATRLRWGFQLTSLTGADLAAGTFANTTAFTQSVTGTVSGNTRNYIHHTSSGTFPGQASGANWTFNWTAPATDVGAVTFYAAGNQANNNGANSGDQIYTTTSVSQAASPTPTNTQTNTPTNTPTNTATSTPTPTPCVGTWSEQAHPPPTDGGADDFFGASVSISGDTVVVGASHDDTAGGADTGSAYIYTRSGTMWTLQQKLTASDAAVSDRFGASVSISGDTVVVGAFSDDNAGGTDAGSVYVFIRSGTVWSQQQKLTASDGSDFDWFGYSVAINGDNIIVGAVLDDTIGGTEAGSAYVFTRSATDWNLQQKLTASDTAATDYFGSSVSIGGETVVVGASQDDTVGGSDAGSAYVFTRSGTVWSQQQILTASDGAAGDNFGFSVSIGGDTVAVGVFQDDTAGGTDAGSAYLFTRSGTVWSQQEKVTASDGAANEYFGYSVAIDGDTVIVGAERHETTGGTLAGSAYVFTRSGTVWTELQKLTASDSASGDRFGRSVAATIDTFIVGAFLDDTDAGANAGSAYIYKKDCQPPTNTPTPTATATSTPTPAGTPSIAGTVTYGNPASATTKFISNVIVTGTGSPNVFTSTAAPGGTAGQYTLTGFGSGSYTLSLSKTTGQNGINAGDASRTAQHAAGVSVIPSSGQRIAADASGNGSITAGDAASIARFAAGLGVGTSITNQWRFFVPDPGFPTFPIGTSPTTRSYTDPIGVQTGQDYIGILVGEVTGNWNPTGARPGSGVAAGVYLGTARKGAAFPHIDGQSPGIHGAERSIAVKPAQVVAGSDKEVIVPVSVQGVADKGIIAYEFDLKYDPAVIQPSSEPVETSGTVSRGLMVVTNAHEPGLLRVVVYGVLPIDEDGVLLNLRFIPVGVEGSLSALTFERFIFNEGETAVALTNGLVELAN